MTQKIAHNSPLEGVPKITLPQIYGGSPKKPFMMRLAVMGRRPMQFAVSGLPHGLSCRENIISGVCEEGEYPLTITAENALGKDKKEILLKIAPDGMLRTPLMGFTTWNAFTHKVTQKNVTDTADQLVNLGLAELGYCYVNLDSGWQKDYGGKYDAILPNEKFPDMKAMYDHIHSLGLKGGMYSTPMLKAWGCPIELGFEWVPGCTRGEPDPRFPNTSFGVGVERMEANNVRQWMEWGIDYLKYDWGVTDTVNADLMKQELLKAPREVAFCVTTGAGHDDYPYWQKNCCSWRDNRDSLDKWDILMQIFPTADKWKDAVLPGHFFDLDMLAMGKMDMNQGIRNCTDNEELFEYTYVAFFSSPIQLSSYLDQLSEFEFDLITNDEIIAVNQDVLCDYPVLLKETEQYKIYSRALQNGHTAYAVFNLSNEPLKGEIALSAPTAVRNLWEKQDMGTLSAISYALEAHAAAVFRA